jgi:hypothetical protein
MKGCSKITPAQAAGAGKKSKAMTEKFKNDPEFRTAQSKGVVAKWKEARYRRKISEARKEQHAKGKGGRGGEEKKK